MRKNKLSFPLIVSLSIFALIPSSVRAQFHAVVFTEKSGTLTETFDGAAIGSWIRVPLSTESWQNIGVDGNVGVIGNVLADLSFFEPPFPGPGLPTFNNISHNGIVFSDEGFLGSGLPTLDSTPSVFPFDVVTLTTDNKLKLEAATIEFIDQGDSVQGVPDSVPTLTSLLVACAALGTARMRLNRLGSLPAA